MATPFTRPLQSCLCHHSAASSGPGLLQWEAVPRPVPFFPTFPKETVEGLPNPPTFFMEGTQSEVAGQVVVFCVLQGRAAER